MPTPRRTGPCRTVVVTILAVAALVVGAPVDRTADAAPQVVAAPFDPAVPPWPAEEHGVSFDLVYEPADTPASWIRDQVAFRAQQGVNTLFVTVNESDLVDHRKLKAAIAAGHEFGMQVILNPYIGGTFSGDEGGSAAGYLAAHPGDVAVSRLGYTFPRPAIDQPGYQQFLRDTLTAFLGYDVDGLLLDEPQYPVAWVAGDYFPYDTAAQQAFQDRFGHPMPDGETPELVQFRRERMRAFLEGLFEHAKMLRPDLRTHLVVLPQDGEGRRGTEDWGDLSSMPSINAFQTDPYWGPDPAAWPWFVENVDRLLETATRPGLRRGIWVNAHNLGAQYEFLGDTLLYARSRGVEQLLAWETDHAPNLDPAGVWQSLRRAYNVPFGNLDRIEPVPGGLRVHGWAVDPKRAAPTTVHVYVDGVGRAITTADVVRGDVAAAFPVFGPGHGFRVDVPAGGGWHQVCAYAVNSGPLDGNTTLGCQWLPVDGAPFGNLDRVERVPGGLRVHGWAIDPDTAAPVAAHVYVDGVGRAITTADVARGDVGAAFPAYGAGHGLRADVTVSPGWHQVCAYAINVGGPAPNSGLGCQWTLVDGTPFGNVDAVERVPGGIDVWGWAIDPDTAQHPTVHIYVDGVGRIVGPTNEARPDVAAAYPAWGGGFGYTYVIPVDAAPHTVCVYAIDAGTGGTNPLLGCRTA